MIVELAFVPRLSGHLRMAVDLVLGVFSNRGRLSLVPLRGIGSVRVNGGYLGSCFYGNFVGL